MRLIDADALIEAIEADMKHIEDPLSRMFMGANISDIRHMPTIEERKTGRWINSGRTVRCSECDTGYNTVKGMRSAVAYNFCPNCGCRMEVEHGSQGD